MKAKEELKAQGVDARVISMPCIELFEKQSQKYKESVIPQGTPVFGLTAGLPSTLYSVVGANGMIYGLNRFGASAPYKVLDEKFGFTTPNILEKVKQFINA
jgi:transketolase